MKSIFKKTVFKNSFVSGGIIVLLLLLTNNLLAQNPCSSSTPSFVINLTGQPSAIWTSSNVARDGTCCAAAGNDRCVYFNLTLDPNVAGIQIDMIGADPAGSLFYDIGCSGSYPGGTIKCISGSGPHQITFCKPGSNKNIYKITSVSKPVFPKDDTTRIGCKKKLITNGIVNTSVQWSAISGTSTAQNNFFNSFLDSLNVASPTFSAPLNTYSNITVPFYVDYQVCGFPIASSCGFSVTLCDTVRIWNYPVLSATINPTSATFCNIGPSSGITLTATPIGGLPPYLYAWAVSPSTVFAVGTNTYFANVFGSYNLSLKDKLYSAGNCPEFKTSRTVSVGVVPTVVASPNQKVCKSNPLASITGTVINAISAAWSGGAGTFNPGNTYVNNTYSPTPAELAAGYVDLYLTGYGGSGCTNKVDTTRIYYTMPLSVTLSPTVLACHNSTVNLNALVSGGTQPYNYLWNTTSTSSFVTVGQGNYNVNVNDSIGCNGFASTNLIAPNALSLLFNVNNVSVNGGNNGTASVSVNGGTAAYSVTWTPGSLNSFSIGGLTYGIYTANVKDANGCLIAGSTVVNEPRCLAFTSVSSATNASCYQSNDGVAKVNVSGGVPAYTYTWNTMPVQNSSVAVNLYAGVYSVFIGDGNVPTCYQTANVIITEPTPIINVMTHTNVSTISPGNDGAAASNPFGGTSPYNYLWNNSATTSSITNLTPGIYSVLITDNKGCTKADNVSINGPICNNLNLNVLRTNVSCYGGNNGNALAVVSGAIGSYSVAWSNGNTGPSTSNLVAGNYSVIVTDSKGCNDIYNFSITQPSQLSVGLMPTNISCSGLNDGSIDLIISGGNIPYTYTWNTASNQHAEDQVYLSPGTYSVAIKDASGCSALSSAIITQPNVLTVTTSVVQNVTCINGNNGSISLNVNGGVAPYTYTWSTGAITSSISNLTAGGYTVSVKDANGCKTPSLLIIPISQPDSVKVATYSISCSIPGSGQALTVITPTGGVSGMFQVSFNNGLSFQSPGVYSALLNNNTTYSIVLKDGNNCSSLKTFTLFVKPEVVINNITYNKCYALGTATTPIVVFPAGGDNGPYNISFDNGITYQSVGNYTLNAAVANTYSIIVKDMRGCISSTSVITLPSVLNATATVASNYNGANISCFGLSDGSASVIATGGTGMYSYSWTPGNQTTPTAINLGANTYTVNVKDINNCSITKIITLTQPTQLVATTSITSNYNGQNISCSGLSDGSAEVIASGATLPYSYNWSTNPAQTTYSASNLSAGTYSVIVKDVNNCAITKTVTLTQPLTIVATASVISNYNGQQLTCYGASNGSASVTVSNGTGPYTYSWSTIPTQTTTTATGLGAGNYSVTITDANGCNITKTLTLNQPSQLTATTSITSNYNGQSISCYGLTDGSASVTVSGATGPYTYSWSTVSTQTTATALNLGAGNYSVLVTDANGCFVTKTITLNQPAVISSTVGISSNYNGANISCFGLSDGSASVIATGGTGMYSYSWTPGNQTTPTAINLGANTYTVNVKDINNCSITKIITLTQPTQLVATTSITSNYNGQNISCSGLSDGSAEVIASGATLPYSYNWSTNPAQTTYSASNLSAGTYSVIVKDVNNCAITKTVTLTQPLTIVATASVISNYNGQQLTCYGASNGSASVTVSNGTGPYTYSWSTIPTQTTTTATGLGAGNYSVTITDANGCNITKTLTLNQPSQLTATTSITSNYNGQSISCYGLTDGSASVTVSGATGPYTYSWSTVSTQTTATALNLGAGNYSVLVTDANGCLVTKTVFLSQPNLLQTILTNTSNYNGYNISCFGNNNGSIDISVNGGTGAYTYTWSNNAHTQDINNLSAGVYTVITHDLNGCSSTLFVNLTQPNKLVATIDSLSHFNEYNLSCNGSVNGVIYVSVTGGVSNYNYLWSNGATTQSLYNVGAGYYYLSVTDLNNCNASVDTTLFQPALLTNSYVLTNPLCNGVSNGSVNLIVNGGVSPITYNWSNGFITEDLNNIGAGTYSVIIRDANGCKDTSVIVVTQPKIISLEKDVDNIKCYGDSTANINIQLSGGTPPYKYNWYDTGDPLSSYLPFHTQNLISVTSGTYILIVTDANGCLLKDTTIITEPKPLQLSLYSPLYTGGYNISTYNGNDGSIDLTVSGGVSPYQYIWSNGATTEDVYNLTAYFPNPSPYSVIVTDSNGCRAFAQLELNQPMILEMPTGYSPNNDGKNDWFVVHGIEAYPDNELVIYNRWGNIVYNKTAYNNEWNGESNNGEKLPDATYFAILEINKGTIVLKGYVELRR